jgi:hypothetical protein
METEATRGRPPLPEEDRRTHELKVRLSPQEHAAVLEIMRTRYPGLSVAEVARALLLHHHHLLRRQRPSTA